MITKFDGVQSRNFRPIPQDLGPHASGFDRIEKIKKSSLARVGTPASAAFHGRNRPHRKDGLRVPITVYIAYDEAHSYRQAPNKTIDSAVQKMQLFFRRVAIDDDETKCRLLSAAHQPELHQSLGSDQRTVTTPMPSTTRNCTEALPANNTSTGQPTQVNNLSDGLYRIRRPSCSRAAASPKNGRKSSVSCRVRYKDEVLENTLSYAKPKTNYSKDGLEFDRHNSAKTSRPASADHSFASSKKKV
ncbi:hypothetical protein BCR41DRAFT_419714 [Lobosporangium transversale]|uniref:Uncharacterized protein n=1 Tax=Lobosporangium transversale TaxID=64571 RepID=A0A1Y2GZ39_9FUNG|nr:hypothetical protein BCR41DRAFT_419714 [Lobosporangium transversale]ORZ26743.1 hypothetical protein BCR41DRAFT_419714 [Lobosporangium transversale]|eukprot:XP_021884506.1 hypothetical protein BCR41DRAFT_419714 [Lobosporangium transversale]